MYLIFLKLFESATLCLAQESLVGLLLLLLFVAYVLGPKERCALGAYTLVFFAIGLSHTALLIIAEGGPPARFGYIVFMIIFKSVLRIRIQIVSVFKSFVDPDPHK